MKEAYSDQFVEVDTFAEGSDLYWLSFEAVGDTAVATNYLALLRGMTVFFEATADSNDDQFCTAAQVVSDAKKIINQLQLLAGVRQKLDLQPGSNQVIERDLKTLDCTLGGKDLAVDIHNFLLERAEQIQQNISEESDINFDKYQLESDILFYQTAANHANYQHQALRERVYEISDDLLDSRNGSEDESYQRTLNEVYHHHIKKAEQAAKVSEVYRRQGSLTLDIYSRRFAGSNR